jgi:NAD(P)-dependent dehydrogenase (short-subunit alcohol dehydrogenase family)
VADEGAVRAVVQDAVREWGRLDCAANCAGVGGGHASTHEYPIEEWDRILAVNLRGTWLAMRAELEAMLADDQGGAIVNVASTLALRGSPFGSPYSASKHGVLGLTRTAAIEYAPRGVRVNAVCPGAIDTPMMDATFNRFPGFREALTGFVPMNRMGSAGEVAAAIAWLCSDGASFITGEGLTIEGGLLAR